MAEFTTEYHRLQSSYTDSPPGEEDLLVHVADGSKSPWHHIENLDLFFSRIYHLHQKNGFLCMLLTEMFELVQFVFVVTFTTFLINCVDYDILFANKLVNSTQRGNQLVKVTLPDAFLPPQVCTAKIRQNVLITFILLIAGVFWVHRLVKFIYNICCYWEIRAFYRSALRIPMGRGPELIQLYTEIRSSTLTNSSSPSSSTSSKRRESPHATCGTDMTATTAGRVGRRRRRPGGRRRRPSRDPPPILSPTADRANPATIPLGFCPPATGDTGASVIRLGSRDRPRGSPWGDGQRRAPRRDILRLCRRKDRRTNYPRKCTSSPAEENRFWKKPSRQPGEGFSSYHPQSAGLVERYNGMLKNKLAKLCNDTGLKWTELLPLALMVMRSATNRTTGLSPHEIVMGRPQRLPFTAPFTAKQMDIHKMEENMLNYCIALTKCISSFHSQVKEAQVKPAEGKCHNLEPGEFVYIKIF
uniref:uncharacterized protein n=1 Tax=Pristiophorus japonicus TaxID=55135 RepID=UPI00398F6BB1